MNSAASLPQLSLQILRLPQVLQVTGLCRSMIYQLEAANRFPQRIRIGSRAVGWLHSEVQDWLDSQFSFPADSCRGTWRRPPQYELTRLYE